MANLFGRFVLLCEVLAPFSVVATTKESYVARVHFVLFRGNKSVKSACPVSLPCGFTLWDSEALSHYSGGENPRLKINQKCR